jgi:hypothetical protein
MTEKNKCEICGQPMPEGEQMFRYHGYSGPCPAQPPKDETEMGTPLSELSGRPGYVGHDRFVAIGETWGYG